MKLSTCTNKKRDVSEGDIISIYAITGPGLPKLYGIPCLETKKGYKEKLTLKVKQSDPNKFYTTVDKIRDSFLGKAPGKAYQMLAQHKIPIITLNVDMLHRIANSPYVCELHGNVYENNFVAYGEKATDWDKAADLINSGQPHDILLVIGMSMESPLIKDMIITAISHNMHVIEIRKNIEKELEKILIEKR